MALLVSLSRLFLWAALVLKRYFGSEGMVEIQPESAFQKRGLIVLMGKNLQKKCQ